MFYSVVLLCWLAISTKALIITIDDHLVNITLTDTLNLGGWSANDCGKMVRTSDNLYHMQHTPTGSRVEKWDYPYTTLFAGYLKNYPDTMNDYDADDTGRIVFLTNRSTTELYLTIDALFPTILSSTPNIKTQVQLVGTRTYVYNHRSADPDYLLWYPSYTNSPSNTTWAFAEGYRMQFSQNGARFALWGPSSEVRFYYSTLPFLQATFSGSITANLGVTQQVHFNHDNTLAIIETDDLHPVKVFCLTNSTVVASFTFDAFPIIQAVFLGNTNHLILLKGLLQANIFNTETNTLVQAPDLAVTVSTLLYHNYNQYYVCHMNHITAYRIAVNLSAAINTTNSSAPVNSSSYYTNTTLPYIIEVEMNQMEQTIVDVIIFSLAKTSPVVSSVTMLTRSNPYTYFFLSFINFFTLCSHYVLINMPLPRHLYNHLSHFYAQVNHNLISRYCPLPFSKMTEQMVDRDKLIDLKLTTDLLTGQSANFTMFLTNLVIYGVIAWLVRKLKKSNFFRKLMDVPFNEIVVGQYVSLLLPLLFPWVFFIEGTFSKLTSKINLTVQYILFFVSLVFSLSYFFYLIREHIVHRLSTQKSKFSLFNLKPEPKAQKAKFVIKVKEKDRVVAQENGNGQILVYDRQGTVRQTYRRRPEESPKTQDTSNMKIRQSKLRDHISAALMDTWYVTFSNFIFPIALMTAQPQIGLITLGLYCILGVVVGYQQTDYPINRTILSLYSLIFHLCFVVFRLFTHQNKGLVYAQIVCLSVLLLGSVHHLIFLVFLFTKGVAQHWKSTNKVQNSNNQAQIDEIELDRQLIRKKSSSQLKKAHQRRKNHKKGTSNMPKRDGGRLAVGTIKEEFKIPNNKEDAAKLQTRKTGHRPQGRKVKPDRQFIATRKNMTLRTLKQ